MTNLAGRIACRLSILQRHGDPAAREVSATVPVTALSCPGNVDSLGFVLSLFLGAPPVDTEPQQQARKSAGRGKRADVRCGAYDNSSAQENPVRCTIALR